MCVKSIFIAKLEKVIVVSKASKAGQGKVEAAVGVASAFSAPRGSPGGGKDVIRYILYFPAH